MIIDEDNHVVNQIKDSVKNEDITILSAPNNRQAIKQTNENDSIDLYLISTQSKMNDKGYFFCKSTDSLHSPTSSINQIILENKTIEEIGSFLKNKLNE
jgi:hypothetical protein